MIILKNKLDNTDYSFFVVDSHHHIGTDVDGHENSPTGPTGSYAFCRKILNGDGVNPGLQEELEKNEDKYHWSIPDGGKGRIIGYYPIMKKFADCDNRLAEKYSFEETLALDQVVVFPMHDKFRMREGIEYRASNNLIQKWTEMYPHSLRFLGFGRVNPKEDLETAVREMKRFVYRGGLRGVKLHPNSEDFLMDSPNVKRMLREAASLDIPVIFHTTYAHEVKSLYNTVNEIVVEMMNSFEEKLIPRLKVIIGHCTYQSDEVYLALSHPNIYGELSTLNKPKVYLNTIADNVYSGRFFKETLPGLQSESEELTRDKVKEIYKRKLLHMNWTNKVMLGTDYPYMPVNHTIDLIKALLGKDKKLKLKPVEIQNILGGNILRLIPPKYAMVRKSPQQKGVSTTSHRKFVDEIITEKIKVTGWDPILEESHLHPMRRAHSVLTVTDDKKSNTSYLFSSTLLASSLKKGTLQRFEVIKNITDNYAFLDQLSKKSSLGK